MHEYEYNTQQPDVILKEYGRNVQKLVNFIKNEDDIKKRTRLSKTLIELMKQLNPAVRENHDYAQRIWNHLYLISGFELEVDDDEFLKPDLADLNTPPQTVDYGQHQLRFRHYGKNVDLLIKKTKAVEDPEEREAGVILLGKLMKKFYLTWNKDAVEDELIIKNIEQLSDGELTIDASKVKEYNLFHVKKDNPSGPSNSSNLGGGGKSRSNNGRKNNGNNKRRRKSF